MPLVPVPLGAIDGALVVSVVVSVVIFWCGFSVARICSAWAMKLCQMIAGYVPPSTGAPLYAVVIGTSLFG